MGFSDLLIGSPFGEPQSRGTETDPESKEHAGFLQARIKELLSGPWSQHFEPIKERSQQR